MGHFFLFLDQIAPSRMAHKRTCYEDFCGSRALEIASEKIKIFYAFGLQLNLFMSAGILLEYFCKVLKFE